MVIVAKLVHDDTHVAGSKVEMGGEIFEECVEICHAKSKMTKFMNRSWTYGRESRSVGAEGVEAALSWLPFSNLCVSLKRNLLVG